MAKKNSRLGALHEILTTGNYTGQNELIEALGEKGYYVTQPTLSRDLQQLGVTKTKVEEGSKYVLPTSRGGYMPRHLRAKAGMRFGYLSVDYSGNLVVLHTLQGFAGGLGAEIDTHELPQIVGSIAGDDTLLLILREGVTHQEINDALAEIIPMFND